MRTVQGPEREHRRATWSIAPILLAAALAACLANAAVRAQTAATGGEIESMNLGQLDSALLNGEFDAGGTTAVERAEEPAEGEPSLMERAERAGAAIPGVGLVIRQGSQACWEGGQDAGCYTMDLSARPWGPTGNGPLDTEALEARYYGGMEHRGGSWPKGMAAELLWPANETVLIAAFEGRCRHVTVEPAGRNGKPTWQEIYDLATTSSRCSPVYRDCWWATKAGGLQETAIVATERQMRAWKLCESGTITQTSSLCNWPIWYRVDPPADAPWCDSDGSGNGGIPGDGNGEERGECPECPTCEECPECPTCPDCPDCPPELPECEGACAELADRVQQALGFPRRSILPDGSGAPDPEGRYQFIPAWLRPALERLAERCEQASGCFRPPVPSTGENRVELVE